MVEPLNPADRYTQAVAVEFLAHKAWRDAVAEFWTTDLRKTEPARVAHEAALAELAEASAALDWPEADRLVRLPPPQSGLQPAHLVAHPPATGTAR
jgi:hypothetical protein